jgi:hypothetical protein
VLDFDGGVMVDGESWKWLLELLVFVMAGSVETERDEEMGLFL